MDKSFANVRVAVERGDYGVAAKGLLAEAEAMADEFGFAIGVDLTGPMPYGIWAYGGAAGDDIVGAGDSLTEALEEACKQMREWV